MIDETPSTSTQPYLIRALHEWCIDNGFTPYLAVFVDATVRVPREYVKDGQIVLNVSFDATGGLHFGNEYIEFKSRFAGVARDIIIPVNRVMAIYAKENGQGMAFSVQQPDVDVNADSDSVTTTTTTDANVDVNAEVVESDVSPPPPRRPPSGKPSFTRVK